MTQEAPIEREKILTIAMSFMHTDLFANLDKEFQQVILELVKSYDALDSYVAQEVRKAELRAYNSGWVKANRLTKKPEAIEYFASQLEDAAKALREASVQFLEAAPLQDKEKE